MEQESYGKIRTVQTVCSFLALAFIRGSFALSIHYGITSYKTPSLLFLLRTPGTVILFVISLIYFAWKNEQTKLSISTSLKSSKVYKRAALLGFFQLGGPYLLFMYAMKYLSPTVGAVFMAATPWSTVWLEKVLTLTIPRQSGKDWNAVASIIGATGMVTISVANLCLITMDTNCKANYENLTRNNTNNSHSFNVTTDTCLTTLQITTAFLALCGATLLWSISAVFSRLKHISLHFLVGGLLNNSFGGLYAALLWVIVEQHINTSKVVWDSSGGSLSVIFLSFASSWAASLVLYYLSRKIGESTNRVMCLVPLITWLEDLILLHHQSDTFTWIVIVEAIGLLLVVIGLYITSLPQGQSLLGDAHKNLLPDSDGEHDYLRQDNDMTNTVQSEEELMESGTSSMQDSVEPPMIHYADDEEDEEEEIY